MTASYRLFVDDGFVEQIHAFLAGAGNRHLMVEIRETVLNELADLQFVVYAQDAQRALLLGLRSIRGGAFGGFFANREIEPDAGPAAGGAFDFNGAFMALHHSINHGQTKAGAAAFGFGGEKGFQTALTGFFIHADAVVTHFHL